MKTLKYVSLNGKVMGAVDYDDTVDVTLEIAQSELKKAVEAKAGWSQIYKIHKTDRVIKLKVK